MMIQIKSEPYDILNNIKNKIKKFLSKTGLNTENNTFFINRWYKIHQI